MSRELGVFFPDCSKVGSIARLESGASLFRHETEPSLISLAWSGEADVLSPIGKLHPVFEQYLPEGALRKHLDKAFHRALKGKDDLTMLRIVGSSLIGRMRFADNAAALDEIPAMDIRSEILSRSGEDVLGVMLERYARFSGVSGVQPKFLVRDEETAWGSSLTVPGATHILKTFDPGEYPGLAMNEWVCRELPTT